MKEGCCFRKRINYYIRIESPRLRFQIRVSERFFCYEWMTSPFSSLLFKPAYRSPLWKGSSVITLNKTSIPLSNEKRTRLFSSSLKSAIQSQCGALNKLNPLRLPLSIHGIRPGIRPFRSLLTKQLHPRICMLGEPHDPSVWKGRKKEGEHGY